MGLTMYDIRRIMTPDVNTYPEDDIRILDSWTEYDDNKGGAPGKRGLKYLCYHMETMNPDTGEHIRFYKAIKFLKIERLPASAKQSTAFMDMQSQILSAVWENGYNLVTVIANVIHPVPIGLLYLYGLQGVSKSLKAAKKKADMDFLGFRASLQGTFRVLEMRVLHAEETEWLKERLYNMKFLTTVRGIPKASKSGEDAGNKGVGGKNVNPDSQGTLEELIVGMCDYEYVIEILSTPVYRETLEAWQRQYQREMTEWYSRMQGTKSLSMNLSIPMTYMANASQARGWNRGFNESNTVSFAQGENYSHTQGTSIGESLSKSYSQGVSYTEGTNVSQSQNHGFSISNGINNSHSVGQTIGESLTESKGVSVNQSVSQSAGSTYGTSSNISSGMNQGINTGSSFGMNHGNNSSLSQGANASVNQSESASFNRGISQNFSHGENSSLNASHSTGTSQNLSQSQGYSEGFGYSQNAGINSGASYGYGQGLNRNTSYGQNLGYSNSVGHNLGNSANYGYSQNQGASMGNSASSGQAASSGYSMGMSDSYGNTNSFSGSSSISDSTGLSGSNGASLSQGTSDGSTNGLNAGVKAGYGSLAYNGGNSHTDTLTNTENASSGYSDGGGTSMSNSQSASSSATHSANAGNNVSLSHNTSLGANMGYNYGTGVSSGVGYNEGFSESLGMNTGESMSASAGMSQSENYGATTGQSFSEGYSSNQGINQSLSYGAGLSQSDSMGVSTGVSDSVSAGTSEGISQGYSGGTSYGTSQSYSDGVSDGASYSENQGNSYGMSITESYGESYSESFTSSVSQGMGYNQSSSFGQNYSQNEGYSYGQSYSEGENYSEGVSQGQSVSNGTTRSISNGYGQNYGQSSSDSAGRSSTLSNGYSAGTSNGLSLTNSMGSSTSMGLGPSIGYSKSYQWLDQGVKDLIELMDWQNNRLKNALRQNGAFYTYVYICCPNEECMRTAQSVAKSTWHNPDAMVNPLQVLDLTEYEQRHLLYHAAAFSGDVTKEFNNGSEEFKYCSVLLPSEYAAYTHLPRVSEGGVFATIEDIPKFSIPGRLDGEIFMGNVMSTERYSWENGYNTPFDYRIPETALLHGYFTGASRSGKTVAAMRFIKELADVRRSKTGKKVRIVVLDPKQDWRKLARYVEPERFRFASMGNPKFNSIKINPWKIPEGVQPQFWIDGVINIYCRAYGFLERGKQMISDVVYELYDEAFVFGKPIKDENGKILRREKVDLAEVPALSSKVNFASIYQRFADKKEENAGQKSGNDTKDAYARILERLSCFSRDYSTEYVLYGTSEGLGIDEMIGDDDVTVLESKGLESTFNNFIFGTVVSGFYKYALSHDGGFLAEDQYETVLVIEEANEVLTGNDDASGKDGGGLKGESEFEQVLDQAAGYGLFIFSITQKIGKMPSSVTANAGIVFAGRLQTPTDVQAVMKALGKDDRIDDKDVAKWFPNIPVGNFICKTSRSRDWKSQFPVLVNIAPLPGTVPSNVEISGILAEGRLSLFNKDIDPNDEEGLRRKARREKWEKALAS